MAFAGLNWIAIIAAAVAGFAVGAVWYMSLSRHWLAALGTSPSEMAKSGRSVVPFVVSFVSLFVMAWVLAGLIGHFAPTGSTVRTGLISGAFVWAGFVATTMATNDSFRGNRVRLTMIDATHWLLVLLVQGAIIGWLGVVR